MAEASTKPAYSVPHSLSHLIVLNIEYGVVICIGNGCRCAVSPSSLVLHLERKHSTPIELRKQVADFIELLPFEYDYSDVQIPADQLAPQPIIPIVDGFQCKHCVGTPFRSTSRKWIKQHGNKAHSQNRVRDEELFDAVRLQSWFRGSKERYWVVDKSKPPEPGATRSRTSIRREDNVDQEQIFNDDEQMDEDINDDIVKEIEEWRSEAQGRRLTLLDKPPADEFDPWFRYTQWNEVLSQSKHGLVETHRYTREPDADEPELERVLEAWNRIMVRCLDTLKANDHCDTLKWWASPKNEIASQQPFELPQNTRSINKYSGVYQHFICYVMRTCPAEWGDDSETGVEFNEKQFAAICQIRTILETEAPEGELTDASEQDFELTVGLMRLCIAVVMQDMGKLSTYQSPLMHFLAVMGVDVRQRRLRTSFSYTPILAAVLFINRLILLEVAVPSEPWPMLKRRDEIDDIAKRIQVIRRRSLTEGSFSPTSAILSQLAKGKALNRLHKSQPNIHWSVDEQTIFYAGLPVALAKLRQMCQELNGELRAMLDELMFGSIPAINLNEIVDSMSWGSEFRRDEFSFLQHPKNQKLFGGDSGYKALLKRSRKADGERKMMITAVDGKNEWIDQGVQAYLIGERRFLQRLMVAIHIQYGQPARGPELGSIKVSNSVYSARNLYIINGRVCFLTTYDKARKRRGNIEHVVRFLPDVLSQILVQYIVYVRPFSRVLDRRESEYLFADLRGPWAGEELTYALGPVTEKRLGARLTTSSWRQVAVGIATRHLIRISKTWDKDKDNGDEDELAGGDDEHELEEATFQHIMVRQAGHGVRVAQNHYAIDSAFLHRLGPEIISVYERASIAWHGLLELHSEGDSGVDKEAVGLKKAGHRREASQQIGPGSEKKVKISKQKGQVVQKAMAGLRKIFGPTAQPQSEGQAAALELVHKPPRTSIIVLPTGSGKSALIFSVAAMAEQQTVIVVVPFAALVNDIVSRGREAGLHCEEWVGGRTSGELQQLVVVSADRAVNVSHGDSFIHYAQGLRLNNQLAHMFFDECHVAFTDTSYRESLRELWKLRYIECPFTCLTATLMIQLEDKLRDQLLIPHAKLFRQSTARRTIRYRVCDSGDEAPSSFGLELIQGLVLPERKRGVVYARSYATGKVISEALGCPFYRAQADDKGEILREWMRGFGWIVATGALGTGINITDIIFVLHIDRPYGLTSFAQQSGRGGRGGEVSESVVVVRVATTSGRRRKEVLSDYSVESIDEEALTEYLQKRGCRRQVMAKYFDGETDGVDCHSTNSVLCDWCTVQLDVTRRRQRELVVDRGEGEVDGEVEVEQVDGDIEVIVDGEVVGSIAGSEEDRGATGSELIAKRLQEGVEANEELFKAMDILKTGCMYCHLMQADGGQRARTHSYLACGHTRGSSAKFWAFKQWSMALDRADHGEEFRHCYNCGLSQEVCQSPETRQPCEYPNVMLPGLFILHKEEQLEGIIRTIGFQGEYSTDIWEWMKGDAEGFGSKVETNWMRTWRKVCGVWLEIRS